LNESALACAEPIMAAGVRLKHLDQGYRAAIGSGTLVDVAQ
jgi:hypothetical protein